MVLFRIVILDLLHICVADIFQIGSRKFKKILQKIIKMIIRASKVSMKNINKSLKRMKNFMRRFMIIFLKVSTVKERSI